jgi:glutamate racemase
VTLGVLDWGIGGLDVVAKLRARGVQTPVLYVSDAGAVPYGKQSDADLTARVVALVDALAEHGCKRVIVGCNAASTVLADARFEARSVHGVIEPGIEAALRSGAREVTVLGGRRTIASGLYGQALRRAGVSVREVVAQPLSALVERGVLEGPELEAAVATIVAPVRDATALISACTHYLAVLPVLRAALPRLTTVIDPAQALAERFEPTGGIGGVDRFWTTGDPRASRDAARRAFGVDAPFEAAGDQLPAP